jgi:acyl phosphate:glycerol-3-phosphate acyltransferase
MVVGLLGLFAAYLVGAIPFGWLVARSRGIDIFKAGSGNIGATNVGRLLGKKWGAIVFALDFLKGAIPVAAMRQLPAEIHDAFGYPDVLPVGAAICAFLGHIFPVYLKFRGGKGVATGAGTVAVLVPGLTLVAVVTWLAFASATRIVSLSSIVAVTLFGVLRLLTRDDPFDRDSLVLTGFCVGGSLLLIVKHRTNIRRLIAGTENRLESKSMWDTLGRVIHVLSLGIWFGSAVMFNFVAAPAIFESFKDVVERAPSDRTANQPLNPGGTDEQKKQLASALAGAAVGPIFPKYFALQLLCAGLATITALGWRSRPGRVHVWRVRVLAAGFVCAIVSRPLADKVSALRLERFTDDAAKAAFGEWHLMSLGLSFLTAILAGTALTMAARLPESE